MIKKLVLAILIISIPCIGFSDNKYDDAIVVINAMSTAMESYSVSMENASSLEDVIEANIKLSDALEELGSEMKSISEQYLDWVKNLPEEVRVVMERYVIASGKFSQSLQKAV